MNSKLYVGNLSYQTSESTLEAMFAQAGTVQSVRVMRDMSTGRSRGFGFVEMDTDDAAQAAINQFHETELEGRRLAVNVAKPQTARFSGGDAGGRRSEPRW